MSEAKIAGDAAMVETVHRDGRSGLIQVETLVGPAERPWGDYRESAEPGWSAGVNGPYLIATRVTTAPASGS